MKKIIAIMLAVIIFNQGMVYSNPLEEKKIYTNEISKTYTGNVFNTDKIKNLQFTDISGNFFENEIAKMGGLDIVKGMNDKFYPNNSVKNQEVIAFLMRLQGLEKAAMDASNNIRLANPTVDDLWAMGYLNVAMNQGLITNRDYNQSRAADQESLDKETSFLRLANATREDVAVWVHDLILINTPTAFNDVQKMQKVLTFIDFRDITPENIEKINNITTKGIMNGRPNGTFDPKGNVTRGEITKILSNIESQYEYLGYTTKKGTVRGSRTLSNKSDLINDKATDKYIRVSDGSVDIIRNYTYAGSGATPKTMEVPVYRNGMKGVDSLEFGDEIEYVVDNFTDEVKYVGVLKTTLIENKIRGKLWEVDFINREITLKDQGENMVKYPLSLSLINTGDTPSDNKLFIDEKYLVNEKLPYESVVEITTINNVVSKIEFIGTQELYQEFKGIVLENEANLGYMIILLNNGKKVLMNYYSNDIEVEKLQHFDQEDNIGYIDQVFPSFKYDPMDTTVADIDPGDIVFVMPYKNDQTTIEKISVATNYMMKNGKIKKITNGVNSTSLLIEYLDGNTSLFDIGDNVPMLKKGKLININDLQVGDSGKFLINRAILSPGNIIESIKEIIIEGETSHIDDIVKGKIVGVNTIQEKITLKNVQPLQVGRWGKNVQINDYKLEKGTKIFYNGDEVSISYVNKYLRDSTAYMAIQKTIKGDEIKKMSLYTGRDMLLPRDRVVNTNGIGTITLSNGNKKIKSNKGTIIVREGRLVDSNNVFTNDYGTTVLNGGMLAVMEIVKDTGKIDDLNQRVVNGKITQITDGVSFKLGEVRVLDNGQWRYSPINKEILIDPDTVIVMESGVVNINDFVGYGENTLLGTEVNVLVKGSYGSMITQGTKENQLVKGRIYSVEDGLIKLREVVIIDKYGRSKIINDVSINILKNTLVLKNGNSLKVGEGIIGTVESVEEITNGMTLNGNVIKVDKY